MVLDLSRPHVLLPPAVTVSHRPCNGRRGQYDLDSQRSQYCRLCVLYGYKINVYCMSVVSTQSLTSYRAGIDYDIRP